MGPLWAHDTQSDTKHKKFLECVLTGNSKLYLGKVYTEDQLAKLNDEEVEKLFNNYEAKLSGQIVKSLGHSIINMYSMGACAARYHKTPTTKSPRQNPPGQNPP